MEKLAQLLGLPAGTRPGDVVLHILTRVVPAIYSAVAHYRERINQPVQSPPIVPPASESGI